MEANEHEIENSELDKIEKLKKFLTDGCGCHLGNSNGPCSKQFEDEVLVSNLLNVMELTTAELDLVILASIQAFTKSEEIGDKRTRTPRCAFLYKSRTICKAMFLRLYGISEMRFRNLREHYEANGLVPRTHGNTKRLPWNSLSQSSTEDIKSFIENYAEENAFSLPGRIPGYKDDDIRLLSSCETKTHVWKSYVSTCETAGKKSIGLTKFLYIWQQFFPNVVVAKPRTDLCMTCQQNTVKLQKAVNASDAEKSDCIVKQQEHLTTVQAERKHYQHICKNTTAVLNATPAETKPSVMHYSFDYAQQVHIPSNPMQPGPIYFKTPRKCAIFGIVCEAVPRQVNFLIDEGVDCGKGANATISYVHYYLQHYGLGEDHVQLSADNCSGQGKNNYFIWYLMWRTLLHLHSSIDYSFLIAGHTKFAPDRYFGLIKKAYKVNYVSSLYEFAELVDMSIDAGGNKSQLVGTHDGKVIVPVYDWVSFLEPFFCKLPSIKKYHHFRLSKDNPGIVYCKEFASSNEKSVKLLRNACDVPATDALPVRIAPQGLTKERKNYLYKEIRQFCKPGTENLVAPRP